MTIPRALPRAQGLALSLSIMLAAPAFATPAHTQTYTPTVDASPDLGVIVTAPTTPTTFSFASSSGTVTQSGNAVRRTGGSTRAKVTIGCSGNGQDCAHNIYVKIGSIGSPTGKAGTVGNFNVTAISGTISSESGANPHTFIIKPQNKSTDASFYIGADFPTTAGNSAGAFGAANSQFYVYVGAAANPSTGPTVTATATTYRGISITGSSLAFGTITEPASGTTTVTLGPGSDTVVLTGGTASVATGSAQRAAYTVSGEGGMAITVTVDPSFTLNRDLGGGSITVATNHTTLPTTIPGAIGAAGSTSTFYVGGSFNITSSTVTGGYTGHFNVTAVYN